MVLETSRDNYYNPEMIFSVKRVRYDRINKMIFISWITPFFIIFIVFRQKRPVRHTMLQDFIVFNSIYQLLSSFLWFFDFLLSSFCASQKKNVSIYRQTCTINAMVFSTMYRISHWKNASETITFFGYGIFEVQQFFTIFFQQVESSP